MSAQPRAAGVQLHITSLPEGRLGPEARRFVEWLSAAGLSYWQVLPLGPPDRHRSPYKSRSAFAVWPGLLEHPEAPVTVAEEEDFRARQAFWVGDWERAAGGRRALREQVRLEREWLALRHHAHEHGVSLIGDMPLYVAPRSVDQRAHPRLFADGVVAGAPPDDFTPLGQLWGNPVYDWPALRRSGYRWWVERLRRAVELFDLIRIDHFRGLVAYWSIPEASRSAGDGHWHRGPGGAPIEMARRELGELPLIAEDLGVITPPVERLRRRLGIPGMAVMQFLLGIPGASSDPLGRLAADRILYTGTHDQNTLMGWWNSLAPGARADVAAAQKAAAVRPGNGPWPLLRLAAAAPSQLVMTQMQDLLGLGGEARMNTPGRAAGNWSWRMAPGSADARLAKRVRALLAEAGRLR